MYKLGHHDTVIQVNEVTTFGVWYTGLVAQLWKGVIKERVQTRFTRMLLRFVGLSYIERLGGLRFFFSFRL